MDYPWRLRPPPAPISGNICPTCSISHFPFCPPHPSSFTQNPRFQSPNDQFYHRPHFDPFLDHRGPGMSLHPPFVDGFGHHPPSLLRNSGLDGDPNGQLHGRPQFGDYSLVNGVHSYDNGSVGFKRTRVDDSGLGLSSSRVSTDDERRLKLIRDHGSALFGTPQGGMNSVSGFNRETRFRENSGLASGFNDIDGGELGKFSASQDGTSDMASKQPSSFETSNFRDSGFDYSDRKAPDPGFNAYKYGEVHALTFEQQRKQRNGYEVAGQSRYFEAANSSHQSVENNGYSGRPVLQVQDVLLPYHEEGTWINLKSGDSYASVHHQKANRTQTSHVYHGSPYNIIETDNEHYDNHNLQQLHPARSMSAKESQYSYPSKWQGVSGPSASYHEQASFLLEKRKLNDQLPQPNVMQHRMETKQEFHSPHQPSDLSQSSGVSFRPQDSIQGPVGHQKFVEPSQYGLPDPNKQGGYLPFPAGANLGRTQASGVFNVQPPLPASPPPPLPVEPPRRPLSGALASSSPPKSSASLFPFPVVVSANLLPSYSSAPEVHPSANNYHSNHPHQNASSIFATEEFQTICRASSNNYLGESRHFPLRHLSSDKPKVLDASHIFKNPHRATRPDHIVIILRGLPGSGKSYLAKMLRDLEVENGGTAPRIHSMDDYFMTEVEKVEESEVSKSSGSARGKKPVTKKVIEYCYEPEMEEAYRSSMLKAFKKTLDEGVFSFIIVDDRNLRVADFAQFWATAKRSGYEVYLLEATYKDPVGCAARNVHGFTQDDIQEMAEKWEEAPSLYLKLDIKSLLHGDGLEESGIQEVDMDTEDGDPAIGLSGSEERNFEVILSHVGDFAPDGPSKDDTRQDAEGDHPSEEVKELGKSKWSDDLDDDDAQTNGVTKGNSSALSGLTQVYGKEGKSVRWGDQVGHTGFSIGAAKKASTISLVIGPGAGYNLKSNPLPKEEKTSGEHMGEPKRQSIFQERIRAEHESFRVVFDKRRQRIGGLKVEEE